MRIANKSPSAGKVVVAADAVFSIVLGSLLLVCLSEAHAADAVPLPPAPPAGIISTASAAAPTPVPTVQAQNVGTPPLAEPVKVPGADMNKSVTAMEDKISENAKSTVKHLDTASDAVMLEDLNSARQTVARIEAMIDIEKHLTELEKLRGERGHASMSSLASAIPASALTPPPMAMNNIPAPPIRRSSAGAEITRISGIDGKYTAVLKLSDGETKAVRVGDHISSNATVRSISPSTVEIAEDGETHTLHIKNADAIYSAMR